MGEWKSAVLISLNRLPRVQGGSGWLEYTISTQREIGCERTNLNNPVEYSTLGSMSFPSLSLALRRLNIAKMAAILYHTESAEKWRPEMEVELGPFRVYLFLLRLALTHRTVHPRDVSATQRTARCARST